MPTRARGRRPGCQAAGENYPVLMKQAKRDGAVATGEKVISEGAGITLLHQPGAVDDATLEQAAQRPGTENRWGNRRNQGSERELDELSAARPSSRRTITPWGSSPASRAPQTCCCI